MKIIKFDLNEIKQKQDGFSYYILGRSYDLEENGANQNYAKRDTSHLHLEIKEKMCPLLHFYNID